MNTVLNIKSIKMLNVLVACAFLVSVFASLIVTTNNAGAVLQYATVRFDNIEASTATTGMVCARPATAATEATVRVTFPTGYTVNGTASNYTVSTSNIPAGTTAWPSIATATNVTGQVVTFPSGDLTVGTTYCFNWTGGSTITTHATPASTYTGTIATWTSAPAEIENASYVTPVISDDDIVVSASVPQAFSFALSANTDALGNLSTGSVTTSPTPRTVTVNTNAAFGWMVWAREDATAGLRSTSASYSLDSTAGTAANLSAGTEGYITGVSDSQTSGTGTITVTSAFDYDIATDGAGLDNTLRTIATSNGTAGNAVLTIRNQVAISNITPASTDYTDTITFVGAGLF